MANQTQQNTPHHCLRKMPKFSRYRVSARRYSMFVRQFIGAKEILVLLLSTLLSGAPTAASLASCQGICVCASNIVVCSQRNLSSVPLMVPSYTSMLDLSFNSITRLRRDWTGMRLSALLTLLLSNNRLQSLSQDAFSQVRRLRHLDLSSNVLMHLEEFVFEPLPHLEVLLLYNNRISKIDRSAFIGLFGLQKLYLSHNLVNRFPLELLKDRNRMEKMCLLDVSANRIRALPLVELQALPAWVKNGVYFHGNPLDCSCELYEMLARWQQQELHPVSDFADAHMCVRTGRSGRATTPAGNTSILQLHLQLNCSVVRVRDEEAFIDQVLVLNCDPRQRDVTKSWTLPRPNRSAWMLPDGRLQIGPLRVEDSGDYTCLAVGEGFNESIVVTVRVHNFTQGLGDGFNTAYTTLVCCIVTVVVVGVYLYCTPCPTFCCGGLVKNAHDDDSAHSSNLSIERPHEQQGELTSRHVAFLESKGSYHSIELVEEENDEENDEDKCEKHEVGVRRSSETADTAFVA